MRRSLLCQISRSSFVFVAEYLAGVLPRTLFRIVKNLESYLLYRRGHEESLRELRSFKMSTKKWGALLAAVAVTGVAGCADRNNNGQPDSAATSGEISKAADKAGDAAGNV